MGGQRNGVLGLHQRPSRAVGFRQARVDQRRRRRRDLSPVKDKLEFEVLAWTPGTDGHGQGQGVQFPSSRSADEEELEKYLESVKPSVENAIVLVGRSNPVPVNLEPPAKRTADESLRDRFNGVPGRGRRGRGGRGRGGFTAPREAPCRLTT